jgi:hypothetical protein
LVNSCDFFVPFAISVWFYKTGGGVMKKKWSEGKI